MSTRVQPPFVPLVSRARPHADLRRLAAYVGGVLLLAAAYCLAAKVGQTLRYTASVAAMWPPAGVGIAALYLCGLRWWPGVLLGEIVINSELHFADPSIPIGSLFGQQTGNMAEIVIGAMLLTRLLGPRAALDRVDQVLGTLVTLVCAAAISATTGTVSMLAGGVVGIDGVPLFWRTWLLGDLSGALVVVSAALAWSGAPAAAWRRLRTVEGTLMVTSVVALGVIAVSVNEPLTYIVFPALIWSAFRFGAPGVTLAIVIASALAIGITAHEVGPFFKQPIDHRTLGTQLYIAVTALTTLILSAVVSERERSTAALAAAKLREGERAAAERRRIARELHDSVSQSLFSTQLQTRVAQRSPGNAESERALGAIAELTRDAQRELRALISELGRDPLSDGLVPALSRHVAALGEQHGVITRLLTPIDLPALPAHSEAQLFGIAREALTNAVKHSGAGSAWVRIEALPGRVLIEIGDDGRGFDPAAEHRGHYGLASMRSRAAEIGGVLTIVSAPGHGTVVRVETNADG